MSDFFYKLRKAKNKFKRKFQETKDEEFGEATEYTSVFKVLMIVLLSVIAAAMVFIILLLTNVINIGEEVTPAETYTPTPSVTIQATPSPTAAPTEEPTPTPTPRRNNFV